MEKEKIQVIVDLYKNKFLEMNIPKIKNPNSQNFTLESAVKYLGFCHYMVDEIEELIEKDDLEQAEKCLAFIKGVLWSIGVYTLEELRNQKK
jgi:predicted house-cleaning noncanonical NTP pyrophosphatase (MazG superfamily)